MSEKTLKIKPKVWPKEYTFEEFKQLNPTITENLLINYYNNTFKNTLKLVLDILTILIIQKIL